MIMVVILISFILIYKIMICLVPTLLQCVYRPLPEIVLSTREHHGEPGLLYLGCHGGYGGRAGGGPG